MKAKTKIQQRKGRRANRVRAKILGTAERPRLSVFRSNRFIYAQLIDDTKGVTLASISTRGMSAKSKKQDQAAEIGESIGKKAVGLGVSQVVFDRSSYRYHGRVAKVAEGARKAGLKL